jgi:hypothetical protein
VGWRELKGDALNDSGLLDFLAMAAIISPWTVGRYANPAGAASAGLIFHLWYFPVSVGTTCMVRRPIKFRDCQVKNQVKLLGS